MKNEMYYDAYHRRRRVPGVQLLALFRGRSGLLFCSFLVGTLFCYFALPSTMQELAGWLKEGMASIDGIADREQDFFLYLGVQRLGLFALLALLSMTKIKKIALHVICVIAGVFASGVSVAFFLVYGWKGILIFCACMFPHWIIYVILFEYIYWLSCEKKYDDASKNKVKTIAYMLGFGLGAILLLVVGIYMEGRVNPTLLMLVRKIL